MSFTGIPAGVVASDTEIASLVRLMENMANQPKEPLGQRQPGEYQASEPCYKMINNLQWALDFINNYERKHGIEKNYTYLFKGRKI